LFSSTTFSAFLEEDFFIIGLGTNGFIETKLTFNNDVVKALQGPATDYSNFYVLTDDVINNGLNSRLHLINTSGTILSTWGDNNEIFHPKGMKIISNDNILISE
jgi:hypothetical protein